MQVLLPIGGDCVDWAGCRLFRRMACWRGERRPFEELTADEVVEPVFTGLVALDDLMTGLFVMAGGVLTRRVVAATDVTAPGAAA